VLPYGPNKAVKGVKSAVMRKSINVQENVLETYKKALAVIFLSG
jgi:hypothetical protein